MVTRVGDGRADRFASPPRRRNKRLAFGCQVETFVDGVEGQFQAV